MGRGVEDDEACSSEVVSECDALSGAFGALDCAASDSAKVAAIHVVRRGAAFAKAANHGSLRYVYGRALCARFPNYKLSCGDE